MLPIPENYEALRMNVLADDNHASIICKRPDGGISDYVAKMNQTMRKGVCPACGNDMKQIGRGHWHCADNHISITMTSEEAMASRRITEKPMRTYKPKATMRTKRLKPTKQVAEVDTSKGAIKQMLENALTADKGVGA